MQFIDDVACPKSFSSDEKVYQIKTKKKFFLSVKARDAFLVTIFDNYRNLCHLTAIVTLL